MTEQELIENYCEFLRKGVCGEGSVRYYNTLNPACWNTDVRIRESANWHIEAIAKAYFQVMTPTTALGVVAKAMKEAASQPIPTPKAERIFTPDNEGVEVLKYLSPIEFKNPYKGKLQTMTREYGEEVLFEFMWDDKTQEWEKQQRVDSKTLFSNGVVILKLIETFPELQEKLKDALVDKEPEFRQKLQESAQQMTDDGWMELVQHILPYDENLKNN